VKKILVPGLLLIAAFLLHQDFWLWNDASLMLGLPAGLTYHLLYCLGAVGMMALLIRLAGPDWFGENGRESGHD